MLGFAILVLFFLVVSFVLANVLSLLWMLILQLAALAGLFVIGYIFFGTFVSRNKHSHQDGDDPFRKDDFL